MAETAWEKHCRLKKQLVTYLWDNDLLEEYHKKLISTGIMVEDAPRESDAFEYSCQYDENVKTILN